MVKQLVVSVGAGSAQRVFIEKLKAREYKVAAFGYGKNDPDTVALCDYFKDIDTANAEEAIRWLKTLEGKISGAGSFSGGKAIDTLQHIDREFSLCTKIPKKLSVGMNKFMQQVLYKDLGAGHIETFPVGKLMKHIAHIKFEKDYIVKPSVGRGSSGVYKIPGLDLIKKYFRKELKGDEVIQECISGKEYRVLVLVHEKAIKILSPIKRESKEGGYLLGRLSVDLDVLDLLRSYFDSLLLKMEVNNTILKADVLIDKGRIKLIEVDIGVGGGEYFGNYVSVIEGIDLIDVYIDLITGGNIEDNMRFRKKDQYVMDYFYLDKGGCLIDSESLQKKMEFLFGDCIIQFNSSRNKETIGRIEVNSDFVLNVIHQRKELSSDDVNGLLTDCIVQYDLKAQPFSFS
ncbi:ATP-grasp domain-containing protein [Litchfieldella rifensis]|uniref:ATP-grasp domain-containing protein n=1 Tax=Litchfieldella rifensis TaxID=762643 RepID=A0ABV7LTW4_9GAMM